MAYLPQCTVVVFPVTSVSVFKFTVSIFILKYMHAYFQIVFIAAVYCLFFFLSPCICIFVPSALDAYCLLVLGTWCLMHHLHATNYHLFFFFCSHRVKYTCSNILDTINIIIITHLKTKLKKKENGKENGKDNDLHTYIYIYIDRYYAKKENVFVYVYVCFYDRTERK